MKKTAGVLGIALIIVFVSGLFMQGYAQEGQQERYIREYRIGPWDILEISVYGEENYNGVRVTVSEYGRVRLPLLDDPVEASDLTLDELESKVSKLFVDKDVFQNPSVTINVVERYSQRISVIGAVANPGPYELQGRQKLLNVIAELGGFTIYDGEVTLIREQQEPLKITIKDLVSGEDRYNLPLQPKDIIIARPEEVALVYVTGAVGSPGAFEFPISRMPTLYRAIVQAGGFTERASKGNVKIKRRDESGKEIIIEADAKDIEKGNKPDIQLQAGDVVIVGEKLF
jgi:polysaccharide export outer membrane protein